MTRKRKDSARRAGLTRLLAVVVAPLAMLALAGSASAVPQGEFANFAQCPLSNPKVVDCIYAKTTSGEFAIGSTSVPLTKPTVLQGGLLEENSETKFVEPLNGEALSKTPQTVPGGLLKIVAPSFLPGFLQTLFNEFINKGITGVTATAELVGTPVFSFAAIINQQGTGLTLPLRVHLENPFLGSGCYVGSSAHPVSVEFTTGTTNPPLPNKPIKGALGEPELRHEEQIIVLKNNSLVNNTFAAPEAEGCGGLFSFLIDPAVDFELGLPSASGHNTAILTGTQELTSAAAAKASE